MGTACCFKIGTWQPKQLCCNNDNKLRKSYCSGWFRPSRPLSSVRDRQGCDLRHPKCSIQIRAADCRRPSRRVSSPSPPRIAFRLHRAAGRWKWASLPVATRRSPPANNRKWRRSNRFEIPHSDIVAKSTDSKRNLFYPRNQKSTQMVIIWQNCITVPFSRVFGSWNRALPSN